MSACTAGHEHHATPYYALAWAKGTARFAFPKRKWKGLQQHQTITTKKLFLTAFGTTAVLRLAVAFLAKNLCSLKQN